MKENTQVCARCSKPSKCLSNQIPLCWEDSIKECEGRALDCWRVTLLEDEKKVSDGYTISKKDAEYLQELKHQYPQFATEYPLLFKEADNVIPSEIDST